MFPRLRHHALIGGDHDQRNVKSSGSHNHVLDEALMSRHVYDADIRAIVQLDPSESELDRHAAVLLFGQAIGIDARQRLYQG